MSDSVKELLERWRSGDEAAASKIHRRYTSRLLTLAERQIGGQLQRRVAADDVLQSVFRTFFRRSGEGEYSIDHTGALWHLLVRITLNKVRLHAERHRAAKRDMAAEVDHDGYVAPDIVAHEPTPEEATALADELDHVMSLLADPEPQIVQLKLQGYSSSEIADDVGCSRWTVRRVLDHVGNVLRQRLAESDAE